MSSAKDNASGRRGIRRESQDIIEEVAPSRRRDPRADPDSIPAPPSSREPDGDAEPVSERGERPSSSEPAAAAPSSPDPRFAELEPLFARNAWKEIAERLGPPEKAVELPPALALVFALAQREAAGEGSAAGATELAIKSMAALVGVPSGSPTALVLAKRLLRQNPAGWRTRPAPPARFSVAIIVIGILAGAAVGGFLSLGSFRLF